MVDTAPTPSFRVEIELASKGTAALGVTQVRVVLSDNRVAVARMPGAQILDQLDAARMTPDPLNALVRLWPVYAA